ncbi:MAG: oxidoreductase [Armatimonadota bacterium]|nr:MAG: oxidoreductase [Armatimonadota bacterium]
MEVHGEVWTLKELFVYPNEYIYWSVQIVMYPFMTGLVAGAFVLSSLYHVFGIKQLREMARFSLVLSFALLLAAPLPLLFHLLQPTRAFNVFLTPHFTSAIAAFGIVFSGYMAIVASEIWFVYRKHFVTQALLLRQKRDRSLAESLLHLLYSVLTLGAYDISEEALRKDEQAIRWLAGVGIPVACFLHGYAGFIFGSVKANALWMTPLMPVIFIMSAVVSGIALCMLSYIVVMEARRRRVSDAFAPYQMTREQIRGVELQEVTITARYLVFFMIFAISLELLDLVFREYTALKSWDILRRVIYGRDFLNIFILQYLVGNLVPFALLLLPRLTIRRAVVSLLLVLFGVFMMRWNVVIGGQAFSLSFSGFMHYHLPIVPHDLDTFKEGALGAAVILVVPYMLFWLFGKILPVFEPEETH